MNVRHIIIAHLRKIGATGLCGDGCGCDISDLIPCDSDPSHCQPAIRAKCGPDCEICGGEGPYCMVLLECEKAERKDATP
jgi:hypothetical protein